MIAWQAWSDDTLARAREERRPVLLSIVASWCRFCHELDAQTWSDDRLAAIVEERCLPVRIDKDARPDLDQRYGQGGWPSTVIIDGQGEILAGGTWFDPAPLTELILQTSRVCRGDGVLDEIGPASRPASSGQLDDAILPAIERSLLADFDERHGGFGSGHKFPHNEALDFALLRHAGFRNARLQEILEKTLTHMAEGGLRDRVDGGFYRYCARRDWSRPHTEKLLETNAGLARNFLEAGQLMGRADYLEVGRETTETLLRDFLDEDVGLFHSGLDPDDEYYVLDGPSRATRRRPSRSGRFLCDGNARAVSALLKAGAVLAQRDVTAAAVSVATRLLDLMWRRGHGMFHAHDGVSRHLPGNLRDQAETARSLLRLLQYTDDRRFLAPLDDLIEVMANEHITPSGEFGHRGGGPVHGGVGRHDSAILESAVAAEVMLRAAIYLGRPSLTELAQRALEQHATDFRRYGYAMAAYGRSVELVLHAPLHLVVVGPAGDPTADALLAAASATYLPSRVVQRLDPATDAGILERLGLLGRNGPAAYLFLARDCAGEHTEPETLRRGLASANARRLLS